MGLSKNKQVFFCGLIFSQQPWSTQYWNRNQKWQNYPMGAHHWQ